MSEVESRPSNWRSGWTQSIAALRIIVVIAAFVGALWVIARLRYLILLLILSVFFAYLIAPLVALVNRPFALWGRPRRLSAGLAVGVVYLLLIGALVLAFAWFVPKLSQQAMQMVSEAPSYVKTLQARGQTFIDLFDRLGLPPAVNRMVQTAFGALAASVEATGRHALTTVVGLIAYLPWLVLIPILAFFLLKDADTFRRGALGLLPAGRARANATHLFERVNVVLAAYIRAQLLACLLVGVVAGTGFALLGVPYALVLGAAAGLAEFIPLVGPFSIAVAAAVLAALHLPILALWVLVFLGVIRIAEDYVVYPRLVGSRIDLHPLTIILAVLTGAELGGVAGIFLSVPAVAILIETYRVFIGWRTGK